MEIGEPLLWLPRCIAIYTLWNGNAVQRALALEDPQSFPRCTFGGLETDQVQHCRLQTVRLEGNWDEQVHANIKEMWCVINFRSAAATAAPIESATWTERARLVYSLEPPEVPDLESGGSRLRLVGASVWVTVTSHSRKRPVDPKE